MEGVDEIHLGAEKPWTQADKDKRLAHMLASTLSELERNRPADRSEKDRAYAVTRTLVEQAYALFLYKTEQTP